MNAVLSFIGVIGFSMVLAFALVEYENLDSEPGTIDRVVIEGQYYDIICLQGVQYYVRGVSYRGHMAPVYNTDSTVKTCN